MDLTARLALADLANLPDGQAAEMLNAPDASLPKKRVPVPVVTLVNHLRRAGKWLQIRAAAGAGNVGAMAAVDLNEDRRTVSVDMDDPMVAAALDSMVAGEVLTRVEANGVLALADAPQSWAELNGVHVDARAVGLARGAVR
jgi:hypothetical protein